MKIQTTSKNNKNTISHEALPVRTQFMIFTLFGDFIIDQGGEVWTKSLVQLMDLLDISERAVRSTLSRMTQKGWLSSEKFGRQSQYSLTQSGKDLLEHGRKRIFEPIIEDWDGQWHIVVYSLPEELRSVRHAFRSQLSWLGFGSLAPGTWVSPHKRTNELKDLINELGITKNVELFNSLHIGPSTPLEFISQCWDLDSIASQYTAFIEKYKTKYQSCINGNKSCMTPEDAFIERFWLTHTFQSFPFKDPNLPKPLLPKNWVGIKARELFDNYHNLLGDLAYQYVKDVLSKNHVIAPT